MGRAPKEGAPALRQHPPLGWQDLRLPNLVMEGSESIWETSLQKAWDTCPPTGRENTGRSSRNTRPFTASCRMDA